MSIDIAMLTSWQALVNRTHDIFQLEFEGKTSVTI